MSEKFDNSPYSEALILLDSAVARTLGLDPGTFVSTTDDDIQPYVKSGNGVGFVLSEAACAISESGGSINLDVIRLIVDEFKTYQREMNGSGYNGNGHNVNDTNKGKPAKAFSARTDLVQSRNPNASTRGVGRYSG